jgi:hypothetical protein
MLPEGECCPSCEMLIGLAVRQQRPIMTEAWSQCKRRPLLAVRSRSKKKPQRESCLVKGKISLNRIRGTFHIAPGRNLRAPAGHYHDLIDRIPGFDLSHRIERLHFGRKIPTAAQPLEGTAVRMLSSPAFSDYVMLATPVTYRRNGKVIGKGFEYTSLARHIAMPFETVRLPGIFFYYQFSPYTVIVNARTRPPARFITSTCGLLAGAFAIASLVDMCCEAPEREQKEGDQQ